MDGIKKLFQIRKLASWKFLGGKVHLPSLQMANIAVFNFLIMVNKLPLLLIQKPISPSYIAHCLGNLEWKLTLNWSHYVLTESITKVNLSPSYYSKCI